MKTIASTLLCTLLTAWVTAQSPVPRLIVPVGHTGGIEAIAISPACQEDSLGGRYILTGSVDFTAKLWDLNGHEIITYAGHTGGVNSVTFSPDGRMVLTGGRDSIAILWSLEGKILQTFKGHQHLIESVAFAPSGKQVLTGARDNNAILWNLDGTIAQTFKGHEKDINSVAFSPDGQRVLTAGKDSIAIIWNLDGTVVQTLRGHHGKVKYAVFSPDGQTVLTSSDDKTAKVWQLNGSNTLTITGHTDQVNAAVFSPDGQFILTGSHDQKAKLWDKSGRLIRTFEGPPGTPTRVTVAFSPDGTRLLTGRKDGTAQLWGRGGQLLQTFQGYSAGVRAVAASGDGKHILIGSMDGKARLWNPAEGEVVVFRGHTDQVTAVAFSHFDANVLALTGSKDYTAILWDLTGGKQQTFDNPEEVTAVACSPKGKEVLTGSGIEAWLWGADRRILSDGEWPVNAVTFSPDGQQVLTGNGMDAKLWGPDGTLINTFTGHTQWITSVAYAGGRILTGSVDGTAKLWTSDGQLQQTFSGHTKGVSAVAFAPGEGKGILTGSYDHTAKLWSADGRVLHTLTGHTQEVYGANFSADGKFVLTASLDNTVRIWEVATGRERACMMAIGDSDWVVTSPSGLFDASPGAMNRMHFVQGLEVVELEQLKKRYWEPGLLGQILSQKKLRDVSSFGALPLYPDVNTRIAANRLYIRLRERSGGLGKLSLFVNGKEVAEDINPEKKTDLEVDLNRYRSFFLDTNVIALRAFIAEGWLKSRAYELAYIPEVQKAPENSKTVPMRPMRRSLPNLYAIVVGTAQYSNPKLVLRFPDQDAAAMAQALQAAGGRLFADRVHIQLLSTAEGEVPADKNNIKAAFESIRTEAAPGDILVIYFSGHGITYPPASEKGQFYYLTKDIPDDDLKDPAVRASYAVSGEELTSWINAIPAQKQVLIFDACNSGSVAKAFDTEASKDLGSAEIRAYDEMKDRTGTFILAGAAGDKVSFEASQYGQGLLTYSLLEGMSGLALEDKKVDVMKLFQYARTKVPSLAKGINKVQTPMMAFPKGGGGNSGESFPIGMVDGQTKMPPLKPIKPVFIKSVFLEESEKEDVLELAQALSEVFEEHNAMGSRASLVYVPVDKYENGYKISGTYTIQGDAVEVNAILKKGSEKLGNFQVKGAKDNIRGLVEDILSNVAGLTGS